MTIFFCAKRQKYLDTIKQSYENYLLATCFYVAEEQKWILICPIITTDFFFQ